VGAERATVAQAAAAATRPGMTPNTLETVTATMAVTPETKRTAAALETAVTITVPARRVRAVWQPTVVRATTPAVVAVATTVVAAAAKAVAAGARPTAS
jgi:hypothetical protein